MVSLISEPNDQPRQLMEPIRFAELQGEAEGIERKEYVVTAISIRGFMENVHWFGSRRVLPDTHSAKPIPPQWTGGLICSNSLRVGTEVDRSASRGMNLRNHALAAGSLVKCCGEQQCN